MRFRRALIAGALLAAVVAQPVLAAPSVVTIVASPSGSGSSCLASAPCSLWTAQSLARRSAGRSTVAVVLSDGTYQLTHPLALTAADSGTAAHPVVYSGTHAVFSGGIPVTGWHPLSGGLWAASVPAGTSSRSLYVNGTRLARASGALPGTWTQTSSGFFTTDTSMASWPDPSALELVFKEGNGFWTEPRCDVKSMSATTGGTDIVVRQPCWSNLFIPTTPSNLTNPGDANGDNPMGGFEGINQSTTPSSIENSPRLLTAPGQWFLDSASGQVLYMPTAGENPARESFVMPVLQSLVSGSGVSYLTLSGISFSYSTWLQPSGDDGFAEMQANYTLTGSGASSSEGTCQYSQPAGTCPFASWTEEPAAVTFALSHHVSIVGDTFTHLGAAGLNVLHGSQDNLIQGNVITDTSGSGIQLGSADDIHGTVDDNTISDNWVHDVAAEFHGGVGIWVGYSQGTTVTHNQVDNTPYTAISVGWGGWHTDTLHPDNPSVMGDNNVSYNLIYNYLTTLPDGGAIYTNGTQGPFDPAGPAADPFLTTSTSEQQYARGLTLVGNVALIATWSEFAYYDDEGSDYITWDSDVEYQNHAVATGGCNTVGHIRLMNYYYAQPVGGYICPPPPVDITVSNPHVIPDHPGPGDIPSSILSAAGLSSAFRSLITSVTPVVTGIGPQAGPTPAYPSVLVSGSGFSPGSVVYFGGVRSPSVTVLSANYLEATPPAGVTGQVDITVGTAAGTSAAGSADQYVEAP